jgi:hypothetical protein
MMKYVRATLKWVAVTVVIYTFINILLVALDSYPQKAYDRDNREYPLSKDCNAIAVDMDLATSLKILLQHGEPAFQHLDKDRLVVRRGQVQCTVDFDAPTRRVTKVESNIFPTFDPRSM